LSGLTKQQTGGVPIIGGFEYIIKAVKHKNYNELRIMSLLYANKIQTVRFMGILNTSCYLKRFLFSSKGTRMYNAIIRDPVG